LFPFDVLSATDPVTGENIGADASAFTGTTLFGGSIFSLGGFGTSAASGGAISLLTPGSLLLTDGASPSTSTEVAPERVSTPELCLKDGDELTCITPEGWKEVSQFDHEILNVTEITIERAIKMPILQAKFECGPGNKCTKSPGSGSGSNLIQGYEMEGTGALLGEYLYMKCPKIGDVQYIPLNGGAICNSYAIGDRVLSASRPMVVGDVIGGSIWWDLAVGSGGTKIEKPEFNNPDPSTAAIESLWEVSCGDELDSILAASITCVPLQTNANPLVPPASFTAQGLYREIQLNWSAVTGVSTYDIYRGNTLIKKAFSGLTYTDTRLPDGTTYTYKIKSRDGGRVSEGFAEVTARTDTLTQYVSPTRTSTSNSIVVEHTCPGTTVKRGFGTCWQGGIWGLLVTNNSTPANGVTCTSSRICLGECFKAQEVWAYLQCSQPQ